MVGQLITTLGPVGLAESGVMLPHEHVFTDLRTPGEEGHGQADIDAVLPVMVPELRAAQASGVFALVEATPVGVGRRPDVLERVSRECGMPLVTAVGVYREPWIPDWVRKASETELADWMIEELTVGIAGVGFCAGWIKISAGDKGLSEQEAKVLRAAARASRVTGAAVGSHTVRGDVLLQQLQIFADSGGDVRRFVWIHTQAESNTQLHRQVAERGAWLEYDAVGSEPDPVYIEHLTRMLDLGFGSQLLLSQDRGWYDPAKPLGGTPKPYTYLTDGFVPRWLEHGVSQDVVDQITRRNPFQAFSRGN